MASKRIGSIPGHSTTGVNRGLLVESSKADGKVLATITGVDGKRHAAMLLDVAAIDYAITVLTAARESLTTEQA